MAVKPLNHYSFTNPASIYDEEALTALELAGRTAAKVNENVKAFNKLETETNDHLTAQDKEIADRTAAQDKEIADRTAEQDAAIPVNVRAEVQRQIDNGTFDGQIEEHIGNLEERVDNLLGSVTGGSTTRDAEVIDMRVSVDGVTYPNSGEALREQIRRVDVVTDGITEKLGAAIRLPFTKIHAFRNDLGQLEYHGQLYSFYSPVKSGHKIRIGIRGEYTRCNICFGNSIVIGSPVSDSIRNNFGGVYSDFYGECEVDVPNGYTIMFVSYHFTENPDKVDINVWDITEEKRDYPNIHYPIVNNLAPNGGVLTTTETRGFGFRTQANTTYRIRVKGAHNRFYAYGCDKLLPLTEGVTVITSDDSEREETEYIYTNTDYKYLSVCVAYTGLGFTENCTVEVYENYGHDIYVNGIKLKEEVKPEQTLTFYKTSYDVENVSTTCDVYALYDDLMNDNAGYVTRNAIGADADNTPIYEYVFGAGNYNTATNNLRNKDATVNKKTILITSGTHGYERTSVMATYQFFRDLCRSKEAIFENMKNNVCFKVVPVVTPYSFNNDTRTNKNGVNIARNFVTNWQQTAAGNDYSGASAADQNETAAVQKWIDDNAHAELMIDYHNSGYAHEVSYAAGSVGVMSMEVLQYIYFHAINNVVPYWKTVGLTNDNLIYAYTGFTGNFQDLASSYNYATERGVQGLCLEGSWNQNESFGMHSKKSIGICAEILGNLLIGFTNYFVKG